MGTDEAFDKIVQLQVRTLTLYVTETHVETEFPHNSQTGQAVVLAPSALKTAAEDDDWHSNVKKLQQFGRRYAVIKTRQRVTRDGGASILVVD